MFSEKYIERFWSKVDRSGGEDACWEWQAGTFGGGYGKFWIGFRLIRAHRFAWQIVNGEIPNGLEVCHDCDNPPCCNPKHLFPGTHQDNMGDMANKGRKRVAYGEKHGWHTHPERRPRGERNGNHKLTDVQVAEIRQRYAAGGVTQTELASDYCVSQVQISNIVKHKNRSS